VRRDRLIGYGVIVAMGLVIFTVGLALLGWHP
jgi:hypothetical protein